VFAAGFGLAGTGLSNLATGALRGAAPGLEGAVKGFFSGGASALGGEIEAAFTLSNQFERNRRGR